MRNFQDIFKRCKRLFIKDFSICMTVPVTAEKKDLVIVLLFLSKLSLDLRTHLKIV